MIVFVGQVGGDMVDREAFQEVDYRRMYGSIAKWAAQIDRAERIPEYVAHAYRLAMSGRPGPVVLALPEDMLTARATCADAPRVDGGAAAPGRRAGRARARCSSAGAARRWCSSAAAAGTRAACAALRTLRAKRNGAAGGRAFRSQDLFDNRHRAVRRRRRHRHQSEARRARARRRRAAGDRRAPGRDDDQRLHAARRAGAAAAADPRASGAGRTRPRLSARRSRSPRRPARFSPR